MIFLPLDWCWKALALNQYQGFMHDLDRLRELARYEWKRIGFEAWEEHNEEA